MRTVILLAAGVLVLAACADSQPPPGYEWKRSSFTSDLDFWELQPIEGGAHPVRPPAPARPVTRPQARPPPPIPPPPPLPRPVR